MLKLTDASGKQLAFNDDHEDKGAGLDTHYADSYLTAILPADGAFYIHIGDAQRQGGPEYGYRLRISAPRPDFALRAVPSSVSVRGGASVPLTVYALRRDGFTNEITLALQDAPAGFKLTGARIPACQDQVRLTLLAPAVPTEKPLSLVLEGRATIQGHAVVHPAVPAEDMMQAFAYRHLVPAQELKAVIIGRFRARGEMTVATPSPVRIPAGGTARLELGLPVGGFIRDIAYELLDPPDGISIKEMTRDTLVLQTDAAKIKPGRKGNLIITASGEPPQGANKQKPAGNKWRVPLGAFPAVSYEITP